jgi:hypothetical protein
MIRLRLLRGNCHILLAIELECHRRRREAGADIDLPYFLKRGVVKGCDCAVEQSEEYEAAGGPFWICIDDAVAIS